MEAAEKEALTQAEHKRRERAKRLVRNLMERTEENGCTEAEAMEAAAKIGALMAEFDLELTELSARDTSDMVKAEVYAADYSMATVVTGVAKLCSLVVYSNSGATVATYTLYGHKTDVELATYLYEVCAEACDVGWQAYMDKHGYSKKARDSFRMGFGNRVHARMSELRAQRDREAAERAAAMPNGTGTNLVVLKDQIVVAEFEKLGVRLGKASTQRVHNPAAFAHGKAHGDRVNLERPLNGPASRPALA